MGTEERYNGWANRETWAVALHINNDQGWQESVHEALRDSMDLGEWLDTHDGMSESTAARYAGETIRENVEDFLDWADQPETGQPRFVAQVRSDIGSLWRVDWTELGAAFLSDIAEGDA